MLMTLVIRLMMLLAQAIVTTVVSFRNGLLPQCSSSRSSQVILPSVGDASKVPSGGPMGVLLKSLIVGSVPYPLLGGCLLGTGPHAMRS